MYLEIDIDNFLIYLAQVAEQKRSDAGYSGSMYDGGAGSLEKQIDAFKAGMTGRIPTDWQMHVKQWEQAKNPEYQTYLDLKKKFES